MQLKVRFTHEQFREKLRSSETALCPCLAGSSFSMTFPLLSGFLGPSFLVKLGFQLPHFAMHLLSLCPCLGLSQVRGEKKSNRGWPHLLGPQFHWLERKFPFMWVFGPANPAATTRRPFPTPGKRIEGCPGAVSLPLIHSCRLWAAWSQVGEYQRENGQLLTSSVELLVLVFFPSVHLLLLIFFEVFK